MEEIVLACQRWVESELRGSQVDLLAQIRRKTALSQSFRVLEYLWKQTPLEKGKFNCGSSQFYLADACPLAAG